MTNGTAIAFVVGENGPAASNIAELRTFPIANKEGDLRVLIKPYVALTSDENGTASLDRVAVGILDRDESYSDGYLSGNYTGPGSQMTLFIGPRRPK